MLISAYRHHDEPGDTTMQAQPYLFFDGACDEALAFYTSAVGAEVAMKVYFRDAPDQAMVRPEQRDKVMHATVKIGATTLFASDGGCAGAAQFDGFSISLTTDSKADAERCFAALSQGGTVQMPLDKTFFAGAFGMLKDRFGVGWMVLAEPTGG
jgi:PhnB protein